MNSIPSKRQAHPQRGPLKRKLKSKFFLHLNAPFAHPEAEKKKKGLDQSG
jgi:hypothetical protein